MGLFREEAVGVLVVVAVCTGLILVAVPASLYVAERLTERGEDTDRGPKNPVWLAATTLTVRDAGGGKRLLATAMKMRNKEDAERMCRYLPLVRDRLITLASEGGITIAADGLDVDQSTLSSLAQDLNDILRKRGPEEVVLYDSTHPDRLPRNMNRPVRCEGEKLTGF